MNYQQITIMVLYAILLIAGMVTIIFKVQKSTQSKDAKIQEIILKFSETIIRIAKSLIASLEVKREDFNDEDSYKRALAALVARDFKLFLEENLPREEYQAILNLLDESTLNNLIILLLNVQIQNQRVLELPPETKDNKDSE